MVIFMNVKTMDGLIGAGVNMNLMDVPIRVYKEARRKGDLATMERSMGYAGDFAEKAWEYEAKAEQEALEEKIEAQRNKDTADRKSEGTKEAGADGEGEEIKGTGADGTEVPEVKMEAVPKAAAKNDRPALYTSTGNVREPEEQGVGMSVSVRT